jgi:hypothetical protein
MAAGFLAKPALTRVSAGIYKDASGKIVKSATGNTTAPAKAAKPAAKKPAAKPKAEAPAPTTQPTQPYGVNEARPGMSPDQNTMLDQQEAGNIGAQAGMNYMVNQFNPNGPDLSNNFQLPGQKDIQSLYDSNWQGVYGKYAKTIEDNYAEGYKQKSQELQNRGIPVGSEAYNSAMKQMDTDKASALEQARGQADQSAQSLMSTSANTAMGLNNQGYQQSVDQWGRPLQAAAQLKSLTDYTMPYAAQQQQYTLAQGAQAQKYAQANAKLGASLAKSAGGGGGGGGGGGSAAQPDWVKKGFPTYQAYVEWMQQQEINTYNATHPQQQQPQQQPWWTGIVGGLGQGIIGGISNGLGGAISNYINPGSGK